MAAPPSGGRARCPSTQPVQPFIRHLTWGPMVFLAGMTCETLPTLREQYTDVLHARRRAAHRDRLRLEERRARRVLPAPERDPKALLDGVAATGTVPLDNCEVEQVDGYSRPGKLIEIEITAKR